MATKEKLIIIDGNALVHRAWHALPPLTTKQGQMVNAVYGFLLVLIKVLQDLKPTHLVVTFDLPDTTFRHEKFEGYKATRVKQPDELYAQIPLIKEVLTAMHVPIIEASGYEADDCIGTIATQATKAKLKTIIVTGDMDTLQLVNDYVSVFTPKKGLSDTITYDEAAVKERYGLAPESLVEYRALKGDPSDNIPGVKGIGEKTAIEIIKKFGTVDKLYTAIKKSSYTPEAPITPRLKELLLLREDEALMSRELSEIVCDVPLKTKIPDFVRQSPDLPAVSDLFQKFEFKSLLSKIDALVVPGALPIVAAPRLKNENYVLVDSSVELEKLVAALKKQTVVVLDTETTGLNPRTTDLLGLSFSWEAGRAYYVQTDGKPEVVAALKPILEDKNIAKWGHNVKFDLEVLAHAGVTLRGISGDTMLASYLLSPGSRAHDLDTLAFTELGHRMIPITELIGQGKDEKTLREVPLAAVAEYAAEDADFTWQLKEKLEPELTKAKLTKLFNEIEVPLVPVLAAMETIGIGVDENILEILRSKAAKQLKITEEKIYKLAGVEFNISSPKQLQEILFVKLNLSTTGIAKTKTGYSTAAMELEKMMREHEIIPLISEYRELSKLISTYLDALPTLIEADGRLHTSFNQTIAATGRLSSADPNLQNIPVRTELGAAVRNAFIAEKGYTMLSADYSQIELRIVASLANDQTMIDIFKKGEDIHRATAATIHGVPLDQVTHDMRYSAKEVNFGVIYGMGAWGLSARTGLSPEEAREFIQKYFASFAGVKAYLENTIAEARKIGYVESLFGRRRYLPEINASAGQVRAAAERMAVNMPVQGTAADLMKIAMIKVHKKLAEISPKARLVLQVHDELLLEVPNSDVEKVAKFVKNSMEGVAKLKVPIEVHVKAGQSWGEMGLIILNS